MTPSPRKGSVWLTPNDNQSAGADGWREAALTGKPHQGSEIQDLVSRGRHCISASQIKQSLTEPLPLGQGAAGYQPELSTGKKVKVISAIFLLRDAERNRRF